MRTPDGVVLPLARTDVCARIAGPIADVQIRQRFENKAAEPIEAIYEFPLPPDASVYHMEFRIAERVVRAVVKEKEQARRDYERARREGRSATLLEQDRPSLFTLSVANVPPGASIEVVLKYQEVLGYDDGEWRFVFPMVAPERYRALAPGEVPAGKAAPKLTPPRVPTGERAGDVSMEVELCAAGGVESLRCATHLVEVEPIERGGQRVLLRPGESIANRDFVLTFRAAAAGVRPLVRFAREAGESGTFLLVVTPPAESPGIERTEKVGSGGELQALRCGNCGGTVTDLAAIKEIPGLGTVVPCPYCGAVLAPGTARVARASRPRDVTILVDRSASMRGSLEPARRAVRALLEALAPGDAVQVIAFDHERDAFDGDGTQYVAVVPELVARIDAFLAELAPRGGTELEIALERAAKLPAREGRTPVVVLVTDGAVGNEGRLLRRAPEILGASRRLFVLGLGPAVDRRLVERLARACGGASDLLSPREDPGPVVERFARRVRDGGPVLTGLSLGWEGAASADVYPSPIPDLFGGQPFRVLGRFDGRGPSRLVLTGASADGRPFRQEIEVDLPEECSDTPGLERLWARSRIEALLGRAEREPGQTKRIREQVLALALRHALLSPYTSLVAEDSEVVGDGRPRRVEVAAAELDEGEQLAPQAAPAAEPGPWRGMPTPCAAPGAAPPPAPLPCPAPAAFAPPPCPGAPPPPVAPAAAAGPLAWDEIAPAPACAPAPPPPGLLHAVGMAARRVFDGVFEDALGRTAPEPGPPPHVCLSPAFSPPLPPFAQQIPIEAPGSDAYDKEELRWLKKRRTGELDLVFLVDETGSMGPYIGEVKARLLDLVKALRASPLCRSLRLGLVTYRDHPPQDRTYASRAVELTDDIALIEKEVRSLQASGGGDGPESVTDGLFDVVRLGWRQAAARAVVWFGDAPPHGVEPVGDAFPQGCPCGNHWYAQAESCREMGVAIYAVGCRPAILGYAGAEDVFRTVARTTRGTYLPLTRAELLVPLIAGAAATELDKQRIDEKLADVLAAHAEALGRTDEPERIRWLADVLRADGVRPRTMDYDPDCPAPAPLRFRYISAADVEASLDRLRLTGRTSL
ncbi:MAG: VWA domain-containing protein [Deltaproteobacteria bacterium]|nr:VWA domain-containing protein [Deltaproteobacteria bacterium]